MPSSNPPDPTAGAAVYSRPLLLRLFYDILVLSISNTFIWRCSTSHILLPFFKARASPKHLDIGVGTGYFLKHADLAKDASVTLCDLNGDTLATAKSQIPELKTECLLHDVFEPLPTKEKFGSISLMYLLHCMPGPPERKAAIFGHLKNNLEEGGVLFGATILGKGVEHNWAGRYVMKFYNKKGIFGNWDDGAEVFLKELKMHFEDVDARVEGVVLLFTARGPR